MTSVVDLGEVSAYALAVKYGYRGTEEEWVAEMQRFHDEAGGSAGIAAEKAKESSDYADMSRSYAVGTENAVRENDSADNAKAYSEQSKNSADEAADSVKSAEEKAEESSGHANLSKSYAVGTENVVRENDSTDNSKYYSEQSKISADEAKSYLEQTEASGNEAASKIEQAGNAAADKINNAFDVMSPNFVMDLETGHLLYDGNWVDFKVEQGRLKWGLVA